MATNIGPLKTKTDKRDQNFGTSHNPKHDPIPAHQINNHREKYPLFLYSVSCVISTRRKFSFVYLLLPKAPTWTQPLPPEHIIILLLISIQRFNHCISLAGFVYVVHNSTLRFVFVLLCKPFTVSIKHFFNSTASYTFSHRGTRMNK